MTSAESGHRAVGVRAIGRPLALVLIVALALPAQGAAADPLPVHDAGTGGMTTAGAVEAAAQSSSAFGIGDVFVAVGDGKVQWRLPDGTLNPTLDTGLGGHTTGMAFDKVGRLYVTGFTAGAITRFDSTGTRIGTFGT